MIEGMIEWALSTQNPGFRQEVVEVPNGDGVADVGKLYGHIAPKYGIPKRYRSYYDHLLTLATGYAMALGVPSEFMPGEDSTLRVLRYPPGVGGAEHTDFDLFTVNVGRTHEAVAHHTDPLPFGVHAGELLTEILGTPATPHSVNALDEEQGAMVFFAVPKLDAVLPSGLTVGEWIQERKERSRK